ncbi:hypothetical protein BC829DRAFT_421247 [Chytridium lagenaria]|nr:hypothetical protein BC829DRAFT_421247 [Chytridium lagenaria]
MDRIPSDEWTIHGLCPNSCSNQQIYNCDRYLSMGIITTFGELDSPSNPECLPKTTVYTPTDIKLALTKEFGTLTVAIPMQGCYLSEIRLALVGVNPGIAQNGVQDFLRVARGRELGIFLDTCMQRSW